jgi:hypothetical protein
VPNSFGENGNRGIREVREMTEHDQWLEEQLQDADFAAEYLNAA